jgi:hypothetical protein
MDQAKAEIFRLKGEVLRIASEIVRRDGGTMDTYVLSREDLECESVEGQIHILQMHLDTLNLLSG